MNLYTRGQLDIIKIIKETIVAIEDGPIDLLTALGMLEAGVIYGGKLRDAQSENLCHLALDKIERVYNTDRIEPVVALQSIISIVDIAKNRMGQ